MVQIWNYSVHFGRIQYHSFIDLEKLVRIDELLELLNTLILFTVEKQSKLTKKFSQILEPIYKMHKTIYFLHLSHNYNKMNYNKKISFLN